MMIYLMWLGYSCAWILIALVLLFGAKKLFDWLTPYSVDEQLTDKDNPALGVALTGFLLGTVALIAGTFVGDTPGEMSIVQLGSDALSVVCYAIPGIFLLFLSGVINDKVILHTFHVHDEIVEHRNLGAASVLAVAYLSSGLIIGGSIAGSISLAATLIAYVLGQVALILFAKIYHLVTSYDDLKEVGEKKNTAAGLAFSGNLLAYGIILMKGVALGDEQVETLTDALFHFAYYAVFGCILLLVVRAVTDRVFLPKQSLSKEIAQDQNLCAGFVESGLAIASGIILTICL